LKVQLIRTHSRGSKGKFAELFRQIFPGMEITDTPGKCDLGIVYGDREDTWKHFHRNNIPYLLCLHDVFTLRVGHDSENEEGMVHNARGIVFTSEDHREYVLGKYPCPPTIVVHLRPRSRDLDFEPLQKLPGDRNLVYAGGLTYWPERSGLFGHRSYHNIFKRFIEYGWTVHVYSVSHSRYPEYEEIGCRVHPRIPPLQMYRELSQYTAGFQSYNREGVPEAAYAYTQLCRPNKLWEYLAAGIPTIGFQGGNGMEIYREKWGIVLNSLDEIPSIGERLGALDVFKYRDAEVIDGQLPELKEFVSRCLTSGKI
jgi:hypothetical protein